MTKFDDLKEFTGGDFLRFSETNPIKGKYINHGIEEDPFNKGKKRIRYIFEIDGEEKTLTSGSKRLAGKFISIKPEKGDMISIEQTGSGYDTNFIVKTEKTDDEDLKSLVEEE